MLAGLTNDTIPLAIGTALAIGALSFVLAPLVGKHGIDSAHNDHDLSAPTDRPAGAHVNDTNDDAVEAAIRRARENLKSCARCGPRVEPDATYCSNCGAYLPAECARCRAPVTESSAAFCSACGDALNSFV